MLYDDINTDDFDSDIVDGGDDENRAAIDDNGNGATAATGSERSTSIWSNSIIDDLPDALRFDFDDDGDVDDDEEVVHV